MEIKSALDFMKEAHKIGKQIKILFYLNVDILTALTYRVVYRIDRGPTFDPVQGCD